MLTYTMDVEDRSRWLIATLSAAQEAEPYFCSEVGDFYARSRFSTSRSGKESYLMFYTLEGEGVVKQGGQTVALRRGDALLMDCRTPQSYRTAPGCDRWYHLWAHIDGPGVVLAGQTLGLPRLTPISIPVSRLEAHFDRLFDYLGDESARGRAKTGLSTHGLVAELVSAYSLGLRSSKGDPVAIAIAYIDGHLSEKISVDDLAHAALVSPSHLIRLFKSRLGATPHDFLLRRRITRAKELLAETTLTSGAIARQVGFGSESNFSYRFTKMVGQSPRVWRQGSPGVSA